MKISITQFFLNFGWRSSWFVLFDLFFLFLDFRFVHCWCFLRMQSCICFIFMFIFSNNLKSVTKNVIYAVVLIAESLLKCTSSVFESFIKYFMHSLRIHYLPFWIYFLTESIFLPLALKILSKFYFAQWNDNACAMMLFHKVNCCSWCNILKINIRNMNNKNADLVLLQDEFLLKNSISSTSVENFM